MNMMFDEKYLFEKIESEVGKRNIEKINLPTYIVDNLKYNLFDWQKKALQYFLAYQDEENSLQNTNEATHLLFNMATGTGKTLLMAALILYYYDKGYRNFIFFVNQNNIVGKTEENFINPNHSKYLFKNNIIINDKIVNIKKVNTFSKESNDIQILFTTIHSLHNSVYRIKENSVYLEDLHREKIVLLGDEAHHLNADTKKKNNQTQMELVLELKEGAKESDIEMSWENTVLNKILNKSDLKSKEINENVLLEFTATVPREQSVKAKYRNKTIFKFELKEFLKAGYTKEINLVYSNYNKKERILQALLFNWYRSQMALKYNLPNFKGVILFRSKTIENSKNDFEEFKDIIINLSTNDFSFINNYKKKEFLGKEIYEKGKSRLIEIKEFIDVNDNALLDIITYLQDSFQVNNCIITNSKTGTKTLEKTTEEQNKLLNSLEDKNNKISAIFTVQRLNEGWDVLNLFDIVRLYEGQNEGGSNTKTSDSTTSEVQLIGRGVRYYPFEFENKLKLKRKFDNNLDHDLRVIEELYYHSDNESRYISQLKNELKSIGYIDDNKIVKKFDLKDDFKQSDFFKKIKLWINNRADNPNRRKQTLQEIKNEVFPYDYSPKNVKEEEIELDEKLVDVKRFDSGSKTLHTLEKKLNDFEKHIIKKALNIVSSSDSSIFRFKNLKKELNINSIEDLFSKQFIGDYKFEIICSSDIRFDDIPNSEKLSILKKFFKNLENKLKEQINPYIGTDFIANNFKDIFDKAKEKLVELDPESAKLEEELKNKNWFILDSFNGTSEERGLINFIVETMGNMEDKYEEIYLLRNEEVYTIYSFENGKGFQPDFLLFLKQKETELYYQIFIEPKGEQFLDNQTSFEHSKEGWKQEFLNEITKRYGKKGKNKLLNFENKDYVLYGLPFYNQKNNMPFKNKFIEELELN